MYIIVQLLNLACPEISERKWAPYKHPVIYISHQEVPYNFHMKHVDSGSWSLWTIIIIVKQILNNITSRQTNLCENIFFTFQEVVTYWYYYVAHITLAFIICVLKLSNPVNFFPKTMLCRTLMFSFRLPRGRWTVSFYSYVSLYVKCLVSCFNKFLHFVLNLNGFFSFNYLSVIFTEFKILLFLLFKFIDPR